MLLTNLSISYQDQMVYIYNVVPEAVASIIQDHLDYSKQFSNAVYWPLILTSLWLSSNAMVALMNAFNMAYDIKESRKYHRRKLIGMMTTVLTMILIVSALIIPNVGTYVMDTLRRYLPVPHIPDHLFNLVRFALGGFIFFTVLGILYYVLPNTKVRVKEILPGTLFSFFGLLIISYLFGYFVKEFSRYSLIYGGLAAVIILMMWLYLCGHIIMIGGEMNALNRQRLLGGQNEKK